MKFLSTGQDREKKINNYVSQLRGAAVGCNFEVKCTGCNGMVSYQDQILHHKLVLGLVDPQVTEKVQEELRRGSRNRVRTDFYCPQ